MSGPLAGIRVLDFGRYAVAPATGVYLAWLGADVIKVEAPEGDNSRNIPPLKGGISIPYLTLNSGKRNILLDLAQPDEREVARRLAAEADVVLENFRPGVMERLGLGYEEVSALNAGVVYCSASGFGSRGPMRLLGSTDKFGQAVGGFVALNGKQGGAPEFLRMGGFIDMTTTQRMLQGVLCGLYVRALTGRGQKIETSQMEASIALMATRAAEYFATGEAPAPMGSACPICVPHQDFSCADGRRVCVAAETAAQWRALCAAIGKPALADDPRFRRNRDRVANREALIPLFEAAFRERDAGAWQEALLAAGVPVAVHWSDATYAPVKADPHAAAAGMFTRIATPQGELLTAGPPWRFSATPAAVGATPGPDEHAAEIRALAGEHDRPRRPSVAAGPAGGPQPGKPLAGLRVVEASQGYAGPFCAMQLGDLGADVVKVEPPEGDHTRELGPPFIGSESAVFLALNRSKRGIVLDLATATGRQTLDRLVDGADVFVSDYLPASATALGIDFPRLHARNPRLVYCSVTAFGESGPYSERPGAELVLQVISGAPRFLGALGEPPLRIGADAAGLNCGVYAFLGVMAALLHRNATGEGQKVEVNQLMSLLATQRPQIARESEPDEWNGAVIAASDPPEHPTETADLPIYTGIPVGAGDDAWREVFAALGLPALADDPRFADARSRQSNRRALAGLLEQRFRQLPSALVLQQMHRLGANAVPCHDFASLFQDEQVDAMQLIVEVQHPVLGALKGIDLAFDLTATPHVIETPPPLLGEHTQAVLAELGSALSTPAAGTIG